MKSPKLWLILAFSVFALPRALVAAETDLPRYSLPVGRQLTYSSKDHFKYENGAFDNTGNVQITVVGNNPDGSIRLVVRSASKEIQSRDGQNADPASGGPENVTYTQVDIMPDGKLISAVGGFEADAPGAIPQLPTDQSQFDGTWKMEPKIPGNASVFTSAGPVADGKWVFKSTSEGLFKTIYGMANDDTFHFDVAKGMVTSIDSQSRQDYGFRGSGSGSTELVSDKMLTPEEAATLGKDVATLIAAQDKYQKMLEAVGSASIDSRQVAADAKAALFAAETSLTTPDVKAQIQQSLASVDQDVQSTLQDDQRFAGIKGKPAPDITAKDMEGNPHKLSDYRGKVVVLDFWYRGCGWCMRAMPQMKQVADDFKDKPVVVLGMNTDSNIDDPKFVIDAMKLNYQTLRIDFGVAQQFHVQGFPSLLVIDPKGIVREFDEGYSPTLRVDLDKKIQAILSEAN